MDASTRPPQKRHQASKQLAFSLVAVLLQFMQPTMAATSNLDSNSKQLNIEATAPAAHDIAITTVQPGDEGLELSARFSEYNMATVKGVEWSVTDDQGTQVFDDITNIAEVQLPAGNYRVSANYGTAHIIQGLTVHSGTKLVVSFVLDAGGLRVLPRVKNLGFATIPSESKIYALSGTARGHLIFTSFTPGEIIKVAAGEYRVESRFENSNAIAVTDVIVRAGELCAVNIEHIAGLAKLTVKDPASQVQWVVKDQEGHALPIILEASSDIILKPGHYSAQAQIGGEISNTDFDIKAGQTEEIYLGN